MEIWKEFIPDYEVSTLGRVRSFKSKEPRILKPQAERNGYLRVTIRINGKDKMFSIHRLVARTFIPKPEGKRIVNHINGIKTDNRVENLEWVTYSENLLHAYHTGLNPQGFGVRNTKLTNEQVVYIRNVYVPRDKNFGAKALADKFGVSFGTIGSVVRGEHYKNIGGKVFGKFDYSVPQDVRDEILRLYKPRCRGCSIPALAEKFGIGKTTVWRIIHELD